jgi:hypothetical protein
MSQQTFASLVAALRRLLTGPDPTAPRTPLPVRLEPYHVTGALGTTQKLRGRRRP